MPPTIPDADPPEAVALRAELLDELEHEGVTSRRVLAAMEKVPRHLFTVACSLDASYANHPLPIGWGQTISQPLIVGLMTQALDLTGDERVLEIGTGSGYQAAILSLLARDVRSIEVVEPLANEARARLTRLGYRVEVRAGDGYAGWPDAAPFDRIVVTAAPERVPDALIEQLADGGILVAPVGVWSFGQSLVRVVRHGTAMDETDLGPVSFVPMVHRARS